MPNRKTHPYTRHPLPDNIKKTFEEIRTRKRGIPFYEKVNNVLVDYRGRKFKNLQDLNITE